MKYLFFANQEHLIYFWACSVLCAVHYLVSYISNNMLISHYAKSFKQIFCANTFAFFMSIPVMPFVYATSNDIFPITIISLYSLSYFIWELIYFRSTQDKVKGTMLLMLATCSMFAWIAMALTNYWFYQPISAFLINLIT